MPASRPHWTDSAVFYHLYPLGCLGAPARNPFSGPPARRLGALHGWLDHLADLGVDALLLGPVFESSSHGYDTVDYFHVDRRLGSDEDLEDFSRAVHERGMRLVLDGVFNHTGRDFWAFRDLREKGAQSPFAGWYHVDWKRRGAFGERFHYEGWAGHYDLAKLNVGNPQVRDHLLHAVSTWIDRFAIDGLRLDAADSLDRDFQRTLAAHCRARRPDFWLMGEVVHGDYRQWAAPGALDATTNYEAYKGLWSSHNDRNYFEIAYSLERQFGAGGVYRDIGLYNFADNHDVDRVASKLRDPAQLLPLHLLLFTMPGTPSIYYGSEAGLAGRKRPDSDADLRPALDPGRLRAEARMPQLHAALKRLIALRRAHAPLCRGDYRPVHVAALQLAFERRYGDARTVVAVNGDRAPAEVPVHLPGAAGGRLVDLLNPGEEFPLTGGRGRVPLPPCWGRVLALRP